MKKRQYRAEKAYKAVGLRVRQLREKKGWTLERMEEAGELSWQQLQKIESGRNITLRTIVRLANALGVPPGELLVDI